MQCPFRQSFERSFANAIFSSILGNEDASFYLIRDTEYKVTIKNRKKLVGPKDYKLELVVSIYKNGQLNSQIITNFYVYVSTYQFQYLQHNLQCLFGNSLDSVFLPGRYSPRLSIFEKDTTNFFSKVNSKSFADRYLCVFLQCIRIRTYFCILLRKNSFSFTVWNLFVTIVFADQLYLSNVQIGCLMRGSKH